MGMNIGEIEQRMLKVIKETIGHSAERTEKYAEAITDIAAQARLSGPTPGVPGPDLAEMRCEMLEQCAKYIGKDRNVMAQYARAARSMAMYERIVAGARFSVNPDGSISVAVKRKD